MVYYSLADIKFACDRVRSIDDDVVRLLIMNEYIVFFTKFKERFDPERFVRQCARVE